MKKRLIIGISGASGTVYGIRILQVLRHLGVESHLVLSSAGALTARYETGLSASDIKSMADHAYSPSDIGSTIASGSFRTLGMIVAPCSIRSMSEIATGVTSGLIARAADVVLKERRRLVLMVRETPLHTGHLRTMTQVSEMGAIVMPPVPAFYSEPRTIDDIVNQTAGRALDLFDLDDPSTRRWGEDLEKGRRD